MLFPYSKTGPALPGASCEVGGRKDAPGRPRARAPVTAGVSSLVLLDQRCPPWSELAAAGGGRLWGWVMVTLLTMDFNPALVSGGR